MKKIILVAAIGVLMGTAAFAEDEENAALGFGIMSDSSDTSLIGGGIRGNLFLDFGYKLVGPFFYGFEFQGDVKRMSQASSYFSTTDVAAYFYGDTTIAFITSSDYTQTYTLWDADFSPRGYLSFDLGNKIQLLGFAGLNYNWQTLEYELKNDSGNTFPDPDGNLTTDYKKSTVVGNGLWSVVGGFRVTVGAFYFDYTRFLQSNTTGNYAWDQFNKDRLGLGINLRF